jgi:hypothetical protein
MSGLNKDDLVKMVKEAGFYKLQGSKSALYALNQEHMEKFANLIAAAEREACAEVCDTYDVAEDVNSCDTAESIAAAIRARGKK